MYIEASASRSQTVFYGLESMSARINWIPFLEEIKDVKKPLYLDFGYIEGSYPVVSDLMGMVKKVTFQFKKNTLMQLSNELKLRQARMEGKSTRDTRQASQQEKSHIKLSNAIDHVDI